jgi:polyhydroxybutyrate depolymerase
MKNLIAFFIGLLIIGFASGCNKDQDDNDLPIEKGESIDSIVIHGNERSFKLYIPQGYNGQEEVPLFFLFHGSTTDDSIIYRDHSNMIEIADRESIIYVAPKAMKEENGRFNWNVDRDPNAADDVSFISALIDSLSNRYKINNERIYASGISRGAEFTFALACDLSERIAAIASIVGRITPTYFSNCNPTRPVAVLTVNGTYDGNIPYSSVQPTLNIWIELNQTSTIPEIDTLSENNNGRWIEHFLYPDGEKGTVVEHFKMIRGGHNIVPYFDGSYEIDIFEETWKFVSRYDINGKIG